MYNRIVLNEPHASIEGLYDDKLSFWNIDARFLNDVVIKWTDWHTDFLFHGIRDERIRTVRFPYSRFIVDAERLLNDPMESIGQGIVYKQFDGYIRKPSVKAENKLLRLWQWHQKRLSSQLTENALLLDCHSFPSHLSDVDICIGYNENWSKPDKAVIETAVNIFEDTGYKVGINDPYSNSETPACPFHYQSMMLEVNKKAYLQNDSINLKIGHNYRSNLSDVISTLISRLLNCY